jgi:hypothetical protein
MIELSCVDFDGLVSMGLAPESDFKVYFPQSLQALFGRATISAASPTRTNARRKTAFRPLRQAKHWPTRAERPDHRLSVGARKSLDHCMGDMQIPAGVSRQGSAEKMTGGER